MVLVCPHCQSPIDLAEAPTESTLVCPACGSRFELDRGSTTATAGIQTLGRFELVEVVGSGAFGTVYRARDPKLDRVVAVKVPRAGQLAAPGERDRFLREARSVARLSHPAIVPVHEIGEQDGLPFLVSDFVQGVTLSDVLTARRLSFPESARLVAAVAEALAYAHAQGVVHRDVKPSNILLDDEGKPHVMDFGLARRDAGEVTMTLEGQVLGTPAYMSPEQARGEAHAVDGRGDVYSLGVVLYQLLTGELPFRGNTRMLLHQVLHDEPRPPRKLNDHIPRDLETICLRAMAKEPGRRYPTAGDMAEDLGRFLRGEPIKARPVRRLERLRKWCRRRPAAASLVAVSVLALVLIVVGLTVGMVLLSEKQSATEGALEREKQARNDLEEALRSERRLAYFRGISLADRYVAAGNRARAFRVLDECPPELRGWEWDHLRRLCRDERLALRAGPNGVLWNPWPLWVGMPKALGDVDWSQAYFCACSADGSRALMVDRSGGRLLDTATGRELARLDVPLPSEEERNLPVSLSNDGRLLVRTFRGSPNGRPRPARVEVVETASGRVLAAREETRESVHADLSRDGRLLLVFTRVPPGPRTGEPPIFRVCETDGGRELLAVPGEAFVSQEIAQVSASFSPDGRKLVVAGEPYPTRPGRVELWDIEGRKKLFSWEGEGLFEARFSTDGRVLALSLMTGAPPADQPGRVRLLDAATGEEIRRVGEVGEHLACFSPTGRHMAVGTRDSLRVLDVRTGRETARVRGESMELPQFAPDGLLVARVSPAGTTFWDPFAGKERFRLAEVFLARILPDGRSALGVDWEGVKVWDLAAAGRTGRADDLLTDGRHLAHSRASGLTAVASGRRVRILDADGREISTLAGHGRPVRLLAFAPDGARLATAAQDLSAIDVTAEVKVWDARSGRELRTFLTPPNGRVTGLLFRPDGDDLAVTLAPPMGNTFFEWQSERMAEVLDTMFRPAPPGGAGVTTRIHVRDLSSGAERFTVSVPGRLLDGVVYTPGGRLLATVSRNRLPPANVAVPQNRLLAWDADNGAQKISEALPDWQNQYIQKTRSSDGSTLALVRPGLRREPSEVQLWDVADGRLRHQLATPVFCRGVAFRPDGRRLAAWHGEELSVWDVASGQKVLGLAAGLEVGAAAWSPDGRRLATAGPGLKDPVKLWDADGGGEILTLPPRGPDVHDGTEQLAFRPDGAELVLTGRGRQVHVWEAGHWAVPDPEDRAANGHLAAASAAVEALGKTGDEGEREAYRHGALFHLGRLEGVDWGLAGPYATRARLYAELGRWAEAEADWTRAVERGTTDWLAYHGLALLAVRAGDRAAYRRVCGLMAERCDRLGIPLMGNRGADYLLRTCALAAGAADDYAPLLRHSAEARPGTQGPILYRAGAVEKAAALLPSDPGPWVFRLPAWPGGKEPPAERKARPLLFLALCRHAQNRDQEARDCLDQAVRQLPGQGEAEWPAWAVRLELEIVRAEVEAALKPAAGK